MFNSVSYYVQQMFAMNKGTNVLKLTSNSVPVAGQENMNGLFASSVFDATTNEIIIKVVNTSETVQGIIVNLLGMKGERVAETLTLRHIGSMDDENTLEQPTRIQPISGSVPCVAEGKKKETVLKDPLPPKTFRLYKVKVVN